MDSREVFTQTDHEVHDIFYYKKRAFDAEKMLLMLRRDQYIHQLTLHLKELEKETSNKLHLYSYDQEKVRALQQEFQHCTINSEQLQAKAQEIYTFNLNALNDGHELVDLPLVDDPNVDLDSYTLGPVTPTIPSNTRGHPLAPPNFPRAVGSTEASFPSPLDSNGMLMANGGPMSNGFMSSSGIYNFPRPLREPMNGSVFTETLPGTHQPSFNLAIGGHASGLSTPVTGSAAPTPPLSQFNDLDLQRGEEILRMISIDGPSGQNGPSTTPPFSAGSTSSSSSSSKPDVIPQTSSPSSFVSHQPVLPISGAMGLDHLDLDYSPTSSRKWSQVAADCVVEGDWQAVGSKKGRPSSNPSATARGPHQSVNRHGNGMAASSDVGANFEQMVVAVQEKYQLTRPEVIAVLQVVRNERNGDMNITLAELMRDAERLLTTKQNILKPASLTARARAVPDHEEPCDNQLCPARLKLLKYRTELCLSYQTTGKCHMKPGSCVYAHGQAELRPLPKEELCDRYLEGKCNNKKCVYAHGASELKNRPMVSTVEYLKSKHKKSHSQESKAVEDYKLTPADIDPRGEECSICFERMSSKSRRKLDCGHDAFHYKCLRKWVGGEGDRSCPLCRSNTLLPDEYPHLGSR